MEKPSNPPGPFAIPRIGSTNHTIQRSNTNDGKQLIAWDCVQTCDEVNCPIGNICIYIGQSHETPDAKCALQTQYLQSLVDVIFSTYRYMDDADRFKVGMHLVPLYSQLCRQKIVEKSVGSMCYEDARGTTRIHPIFKEIRDTMKCITDLWKSMGFTTAMNPEVPDYQGGRSGFGDPNHYANLMKDADNKRNVIR